MRNRLEIFALCAVLLLLPVFLEANAQAMEGSTPVYYNPDGGTYYHLDPDCASVAKEWRDRFDEFPYDSLFKSHWYLLPCSACVDIATQFLWEGEKEFRDAVPVLEQQLKELRPPTKCGGQEDHPPAGVWGRAPKPYAAASSTSVASVRRTQETRLSPNSGVFQRSAPRPTRTRGYLLRIFLRQHPFNEQPIAHGGIIDEHMCESMMPKDPHIFGSRG